jgi:hypothetical protein
MKTILFALLVTGVAYAEPQPATPGAMKPAKAACEAKGTPLIEIDHLNSGQPKWREAMKLYATGAWTSAETTDEGKPGAAHNGCADGEAVKKVKAELAAATWKVTTAKIHCMAISPMYTAYKVNGKTVFESHVCGGQSLDEASQKALTDAEAAIPAIR